MIFEVSNLNDNNCDWFQYLETNHFPALKIFWLVQTHVVPHIMAVELAVLGLGQGRAVPVKTVDDADDVFSYLSPVIFHGNGTKKVDEDVIIEFKVRWVVSLINTSLFRKLSKLEFSVIL